MDRKSPHVVIALLFMALALGGCGPVAPAALPPDALLAPTVVPPTVPPTMLPPTMAPAATAQPTTVPDDPAAASEKITAQVTHGATISLSASPALARTITATVEKAVLSDGMSNYPDWHPVQAHFSFAGNAESKEPGTAYTGSAAQVLIYRADDITAFGLADHPDGYAAQWAALQKLLKDHPDLASFPGVVPMGAGPGLVPTLPFLPPVNAHQELIIQPAYIGFKGGQGIRYVTAFVQTINQLNYPNRFYTFQGLTDDGEYYISAVFPVTGDNMPEFDAAASPDKWMPVLQDAVQAANSMPADKFQPSLNVLDQVIQSVTMTPASGVASPRLQRSKPYQGISFAYPATLLQDVKGDTLPAENSGADGPWWAASPQHVEIGLTGYPMAKPAQAPRIIVYPATEFASLSQEADKRIIALQELLKTKPANPEGELPFLPLINAKQAAHFGVKYVQFQGGEGVRYLTQYNQGPVPLNNQDLFYTFQGLTAGGGFYVAAILPVSHDTLPADWDSVTPSEREKLAANFAKYLNDATSALAAQPDASFEPGLADLDTLSGSLEFAEGAMQAVSTSPVFRNMFYQGVTLSYPAALAQEAKGRTVPAVKGDEQGGPAWMVAPEYKQIDLTGYILPESAHAPSILVFPADEYASINPEAGARIAALKELLKTKPANPEGDLPFLPVPNAKQQMHLSVKYMTFQNGQGVRYLTQYGQGPTPINSNELFYTFQGLTDDSTLWGKYYIVVILPVSNAKLPATAEAMSEGDRQALAEGYAAYLKETAATLGAQPMGNFKPNLADLDALVQLLTVNNP
jgi:hypothetical protein